MIKEKINSKSSTEDIQNTIKKLEHIVNTIEKHKNAYFWSPPLRAEERRASEFEEEYLFDIFEDKFHIELSRKNSCSNVYFRKSIYVNDKKSNLTKIKNILKKLQEILTEQKAA